MADAILTVDRLREVVDYNPETGVFTRKVRLAQCHHAGDRADFPINSGPMAGYRRVSIDNHRYLAHRCAWLYVHGRWPDHFIDHINGDKGDNRLANLRDVVARVNLENKRRPRRDNKCGYLGVVFHAQSGRWRARIKFRGAVRHIGMYDTPQDAHAAYVEAKRKVHEGCTL